MNDDVAVATIVRRMHTGKGDAAYAPILEGARDADVVLIGEATHGTHEFYAERARITQLLIERYGFEKRRRLRHMRRGGQIPPGRSEQLFGQASFAHG